MQPLRKSNLILLALAAALAVPTTLVLMERGVAWTRPDETPRLFGGFTVDNVAHIAIGQPKPPNPAAPAPPEGQKRPVEYDMVQFSKTDGGWVVGAGELQGAKVMQVRVEADLLKHLQDIRVDRETLVRKDASDELLDRYDLTEEKAHVIKATDRVGQTVAELMVGRSSASPGAGSEAVHGYFVRARDSRDIVLHETPAWRFVPRLEEWLDKGVHSIEQQKLVRFTLRNPASDPVEMVFEKQPGSESTWVAVTAPPGFGAVRQVELEKLIQRFLFVSAQDVRMQLARANLPALGLQPPQIEIGATTRDGEVEKVYQLAVGGPVQDKPNEVYLTASESRFLLTWPAYMVTPFEAKPADLFDPAPEAVQPPKDPAAGGKENGK